MNKAIYPVVFLDEQRATYPVVVLVLAKQRVRYHIIDNGTVAVLSKQALEYHVVVISRQKHEFPVIVVDEWIGNGLS